MGPQLYRTGCCKKEVVREGFVLSPTSGAFGEPRSGQEGLSRVPKDFDCSLSVRARQ